MQVPLQAATLGVGGVDHAGPGLGQAFHLVFQLLGAARAQQRPGGPGVQRPDRGGEPRRGQQQRDPAGGQVGVHRDVGEGREMPGQRRRLAALEQAPRGQHPGVGVNQRVKDARQPHPEGDDGGHRQDRGGQQVITELAPGGPRAGRGDDPPHSSAGRV